jgi:hypothetical protein
MSELHHISDSDFVRYHFDTIRGPELAMVEEHLIWCVYCAGREAKSCAVFGWKGAALMDHVSTYDLELYHLRQLTDAQAIAAIEQHSLECQECADRMLAVKRFVLSVRAGEIRAGSKSYDHFFIQPL